jgi:hypothetical protein
VLEQRFTNSSRSFELSITLQGQTVGLSTPLFSLIWR